MDSRIQKYKERLECVLTPEELQQKGRELAEQSQSQQRLEEEKKAIVSDFKAKGDACTSAIGVLSLAISTRREYRQVDCELRYNEPQSGMKTRIRMDTKETIRSEQMTDDEKQDLFINALGEQNEEFVFLDRQTLPIIYEVADRVKMEADGWLLALTGNDREMVKAVLDHGFDYCVYKSGIAFSLYKKATLKMIDTTLVDEQGRPETITNGNGIAFKCEYFDEIDAFDKRVKALADAGYKLQTDQVNLNDDYHEAIEADVFFPDEEYILLIPATGLWAIYFLEPAEPAEPAKPAKKSKKAAKADKE